MHNVKRPIILVPAVLVIGALLGVGLYLFQPWRLFTTVEVNEALPTSAGDLGVGTPTPTPSPSASDPVSTESPDPSPTPTETTEAPTTEAPAEPTVLSQGTFISHEHETTGTAVILQLADGSRVLRLQDLRTSDGPDLRVWLSDQPVLDGVDGWGVFDDGEYVELGALKGNVGNQNYAIPASVDLDALTSVSIWCQRFSVSFGAADLMPAG